MSGTVLAPATSVGPPPGATGIPAAGLPAGGISNAGVARALAGGATDVAVGGRGFLQAELAARAAAGHVVRQGALRVAPAAAGAAVTAATTATGTATGTGAAGAAVAAGGLQLAGAALAGAALAFGLVVTPLVSALNGEHGDPPTADLDCHLPAAGEPGGPLPSAVDPGVPVAVEEPGGSLPVEEPGVEPETLRAGGGSLRRLTTQYAKRLLEELGTDVHAFKDDYAGSGQGSWFDLAIDESGRLCLVSKDGEAVIPTDVVP